MREHQLKSSHCRNKIYNLKYSELTPAREPFRDGATRMASLTIQKRADASQPSQQGARSRQRKQTASFTFDST
jgi:hypothetical protein